MTSFLLTQQSHLFVTFTAFDDVITLLSSPEVLPARPQGAPELCLQGAPAVPPQPAE